MVGEGCSILPPWQRDLQGKLGWGDTGVYPCQKDGKAIYAFVCLINHLLLYLATRSQNAQPELRDGPCAFGGQIPESFTEQALTAPPTVARHPSRETKPTRREERWSWGLLSEGQSTSSGRPGDGQESADGEGRPGGS